LRLEQPPLVMFHPPALTACDTKLVQSLSNRGYAGLVDVAQVLAYPAAFEPE
jgi:hypothetical protein